MTTIRPRLDDRLLGELPRFFGGFLPTVREAFQNAYRAGATLVEVQTSQNGSILTITDNGRGCPDPQILLSAGAAGWGEEIVEPAGLGFFSFLNPQIIKRAIAESAGWSVCFETANALRPEAETEVRSGDDVRNGFRLTLHFTNQHPDIRDVVAQARGYYPFTVLAGRARGQPVCPATPPHAIHINTPVGEVYWDDSGRGLDYTTDIAVWEWREMESATLRRALSKAAEECRYGALAKGFLKGHTLTWFVEPTCGVRPRLPDRSEMEDNAQIYDTARCILESLCDTVMQAAQSHPNVWLSQSMDKLPDLPFPWWSRLGEFIAAELGYVEMKAHDLGDLDCYVDGWGEDEHVEVEFAPCRWWAHTSTTVVDAGDLNTLAAFISPRLFHCNGKEAPPENRIRIKGLKKGGTFVALAQKIKWRGPLARLPYHLVDAGDGELPYLVIAGDAKAAVALLKNDERLIHWAIYCAHQDCEAFDLGWIDDYGDPRPQIGECRSALIRDVVEHYGSRREHRLRQQERQFEVAGDQVGQAITKIQQWVSRPTKRKPYGGYHTPVATSAREIDEKIRRAHALLAQASKDIARHREAVRKTLGD